MSDGQIYDFIVWPIAAHLAAVLRDDLACSFELLGSYRLTWKPERFSVNLDRFYGYPVAVRDKASASRSGQPIMFVVRDRDPVLGLKHTTRGPVLVNAAIMALKQKYRARSSRGFSIHASLDALETGRDISMLMGCGIDEYLSETARQPLNDVLGADGWDSISQLCAALELYTSLTMLGQDAGTLHILAANRAKCLLIAGGSQPTIAGRRYILKIDEPGDGRAPERWQRTLLREHGRDEEGMAIPIREHRLALALHTALADAKLLPADVLAQLAAELGGPQIDYSDRAMVAAALNTYLSDMDLLDAVIPQSKVRKAVRRLRHLF